MLQLTLKEVIKRIQDEKYPVWDLYYFTDQYKAKKLQYSFYYDADIDESIKKLTRDVNGASNAKTAVFYIIIRKTKTSNGSGVIEFEMVLEAQPDVVQQAQPLAGLPPGYAAPAIQGLGELQQMHNQFNSTRENDITRRENRLDIRETDLLARERAVNEKEITYTIKLAKLDDDRTAFNERVKETKEDLAKLGEKYNSNTEAAKDAFGQFLIKAIQTFGKDGDLAGLAGGAQTTNDAPLTPEETIVNETGAKLVELPMEPLKEICSFANMLAEETAENKLNGDDLAQVIAPAIKSLKDVVANKNAS